MVGIEEELKRELDRLTNKIKALRIELETCESRRSAIKQLLEGPEESLQVSPVSAGGGNQVATSIKEAPLEHEREASGSQPSVRSEKAEELNFDELRAILEIVFSQHEKTWTAPEIEEYLRQEWQVTIPIAHPRKWIHDATRELVEEGRVQIHQKGAGRKPYIYAPVEKESESEG